MRNILEQTEEGRRALAELESPEPNGPILELVTEPITAETLSAVRACLGDTVEQFSARIGASKYSTSVMCNHGSKKKCSSAMIRLVLLEGLPVPSKRADISPETFSEIVEICDGVEGFMLETGLSENTTYKWLREGVPNHFSKWPHIFMMTLPESVFKEKQ